jgi:hypothetical protein
MRLTVIKGVLVVGRKKGKMVSNVEIRYRLESLFCPELTLS